MSVKIVIVVVVVYHVTIVAMDMDMDMYKLGHYFWDIQYVNTLLGAPV